MEQKNLRVVTLVLCLAMAVATAVEGAECDDPLDLGRGEIDWFVPSSYDPSTPTPLVILLHHGGGSAQEEEAHFRLLPFAGPRGFLYAVPEATRDVSGQRFWNGTTRCRERPGQGDPPDDVGYLKSLIEEVRSRCNVDPRRVYLVGHSSGAFMSYRLACEHAESVSALVSVAGATFYEDEDCQPHAPVHVLQIHGTADQNVSYDSGELWCGGMRPGAEESVERWASYNRCAEPPETMLNALDIDSSVHGNETSVTRYRKGCRAGSSAELWAIDQGDHFPQLSDASRAVLLDHLLSCLGCSGSERLAKLRCNRKGRLTAKLREGLDGDSYLLALSDDRVVEGLLSRSGRAKVKITKMPPGEGTALVSWGCGAAAERAYRCP